MKEAAAKFNTFGKDYFLVAPAGLTLKGAMGWLVRDDYITKMAEDLLANDAIYCVDVGACVGAVSLMMALISPGASILSLEPSRVNWEYLIENTKNEPRIECRKIAVSDSHEMVTLARPTLEQKTRNNIEGNTGIVSAFGEGTQWREEVEAHPLDDIVRHADIVKIDVEGYEWKVLNGMKRLLAESRPVLMIELILDNLKMSGKSGQDIVDFLQSFDYRVHSQRFQDVIFRPKEKT